MVLCFDYEAPSPQAVDDRPLSFNCEPLANTYSIYSYFKSKQPKTSFLYFIATFVRYVIKVTQFIYFLGAGPPKCIGGVSFQIQPLRFLTEDPRIATTPKVRYAKKIQFLYFIVRTSETDRSSLNSFLHATDIPKAEKKNNPARKFWIRPYLAENTILPSDL